MSRGIIELGHIEKNDSKRHQSTLVYSVYGVAPTVCAGCGVKYWINVLVKKSKSNKQQKMDSPTAK